MKLSLPPANSIPQQRPTTTEGRGNGQDEEGDDISLTSSILSEDKDEYEVETILAELKFSEGLRYLVKWAGYPEERCTWEPARSFRDQQTLRDWKKKRAAIARGELPAFDLEAWERRLSKLVEAHEYRKKRRQAMKTKLGLLASPSGNGHIEQSGTSGLMDKRADERELKRIKQEEIESGAVLNSPPEIDIRSAASDVLTSPVSGEPNSGELSKPQSITKTSQGQNDRPEGGSKKYSDESPGQGSHPTKQSRPIARSGSQPHPIETSVTPKKGASLATPRSAPSTAVRGPARYWRSLQDLVQARRREAKADDQSPTSPKLFRNLATKNRFGKAAQYEPAPDISQLDLRRPSDWPSNASLDMVVSEREQRKRKFSNDDSPIGHEKIPPTSPRAALTAFEASTSHETSHRVPKMPALMRPVSLDSRHEQLISPSTVESVTPPVSQPYQSEQLGKLPPVKPGRSRDADHLPVRWVVRRHDLWRPNSAGKAIAGASDSKHPPPEFRFFYPGEVLCSFSYGPEQTEVGDIRVCGLSVPMRKKLISMKKDHRINIWFQHLCTLEQYEILSRGVSPQHASNLI
jgi:chromo domain-containing protein 1